MATREERRTELQTPMRMKVRETSPERTKVWTEPSNKIKSGDRTVPVIYYLSRNGQLQHPHFMEVPLSSPVGLHLTDVINRLNFLRGNGMASMYSWSCKRSYKNGYVWYDLCENDFIYPAHGQEYILKGSEILEGAFISNSIETVTSARKEDNYNYFPAAAVARRRHQSWSAFDFHEQKANTGEFPGRVGANASTQTDDRRRRRQTIGEIEEIEEEEEEVKSKDPIGNTSSEMSTDETSPPPPDSSPETLESLIKSDGRIVLRSDKVKEDHVSDMNHLSGRRRASTALMQLFSCGSIGFRICGPGSNRKLPRGTEPGQPGKEAEDDRVGRFWSGFGERLKIEDKEYFSGSLIETKKKDQCPALKKSSSYNAERTWT